MRIRQYSPSIVPSWLKWVLAGLCLVLLACFIYMAFLYHAIQESKTNGFNEAKETVLKNTELTEVKEISRFQGEEAYFILIGNTKEQKKKIAFMPVKNDTEKITIVDAKKIISKQSIIDEWKNQCHKCELIKVTTAMVDQNPLWEVTYRNSSGYQIIDYLSIYDGKRYQQFRLKSMFN
ncbi:DUF5590 domain-containing protein [Virgibacillus dakarensis]|nr:MULTISPECIES: DUF5590 domain-containing protein [Bacillaceae]MBT2214238.1 DUF5590 domain-containing protein [Virgibacillus dakarensis]